MELGKQIMTETGILTDASPWISVEPAAWRPLTEGRTPRLFRKKTFLYTQGINQYTQLFAVSKIYADESTHSKYK